MIKFFSKKTPLYKKSEFRLGDVVKLKSGGLPMTVAQVNDEDHVSCVWWVPTAGVYDHGSFNKTALIYTTDRSNVV